MIDRYQKVAGEILRAGSIGHYDSGAPSHITKREEIADILRKHFKSKVRRNEPPKISITPFSVVIDDVPFEVKMGSVTMSGTAADVKHYKEADERIRNALTSAAVYDAWKTKSKSK